MKTKLPLLLGTLFLAGTINAQTVDEWQRYTVAGEEFSVKLPGRPVLSPLQVWVSRLQKKRSENTLLASSEGVHYTVYSYENPKPRQSLDDFIAEQTTQLKPKRVAKRNLKRDGLTGHEYAWIENDRVKIEQYFATKEHLYRFVVTGASADDPRAQQFFSSILFGENPEGIAIGDGPGGNGEKIYTAKEVDQKARITRAFPPDYTDEARKNQVTGTVYLKVALSSTGQITHISVVSGLPFGLTERAIAAARKTEFTPAVKDGKNVSMWMQLEYNFTQP